jgi:pyrroline-5-carboxylate reductase
MKLGFVGSGSIASAIVIGLRAAGNADPIEMSPRNAEVAANLADRFENVQVAPTNQAVLDASDLVVLAVRPQIASIVLPELRFRSDQHVVSLIPTLSLDYLRSVTAPAAVVTRAVPLPSVARRQGPTAIYPPSEPIKAFFDSLGTAIELDNESEFDAFTTATAIIASYFTLADVVTGWMTRHGAAPEKAQAFVSKMLRGLAETSPAAPGRSFAALAEEYQTRGGLNEQVLRSVTDQGMFATFENALDAVLERLVAAHK